MISCGMNVLRQCLRIRYISHFTCVWGCIILGHFYCINLHSLQDFEIDEQSAEYLSLHPLAQQATKKRPSLIEEHFEPILQDDEGNSDSEGLATSEDDFEKDKEEEKKNSKRVR